MQITDPTLEAVFFGFVVLMCTALVMLVVCGVAGIASIILGAHRKRTDAIMLGVVSIVCSLVTPFIVDGPAGPTFMLWIASVVSAAVAIKMLTNRWYVLYAFAVVITFGVIAFAIGCTQILG